MFLVLFLLLQLISPPILDLKSKSLLNPRGWPDADGGVHTVTLYRSKMLHPTLPPPIPGSKIGHDVMIVQDRLHPSSAGRMAGWSFATQSNLVWEYFLWTAVRLPSPLFSCRPTMSVTHVLRSCSERRAWRCSVGVQAGVMPHVRRAASTAAAAMWLGEN